jgi:hypothetical protein
MWGESDCVVAVRTVDDAVRCARGSAERVVDTSRLCRIHAFTFPRGATLCLPHSAARSSEVNTQRCFAKSVA